MDCPLPYLMFCQYIKALVASMYASSYTICICDKLGCATAAGCKRICFQWQTTWEATVSEAIAIRTATEYQYCGEFSLTPIILHCINCSLLFFFTASLLSQSSHSVEFIFITDFSFPTTCQASCISFFRTICLLFGWINSHYAHSNITSDWPWMAVMQISL